MFSYLINLSGGQGRGTVEEEDNICQVQVLNVHFRKLYLMFFFASDASLLSTDDQHTTTKKALKL
jgi:hypothetical protein